MTDRELLELILENQKTMQMGLSSMQKEMSSMQLQIKELDKKVEVISNKVADNYEYLVKIDKSMDFVKSRQTDIEEEIYHIKRRIS